MDLAIKQLPQTPSYGRPANQNRPDRRSRQFRPFRDCFGIRIVERSEIPRPRGLASLKLRQFVGTKSRDCGMKRTYENWKPARPATLHRGSRRGHETHLFPPPNDSSRPSCASYSTLFHAFTRYSTLFYDKFSDWDSPFPRFIANRVCSIEDSLFTLHRRTNFAIFSSCSRSFTIIHNHS